VRDDDIDRQAVARLAEERGKCSVKACGAVNVPLVWIRWDAETKSISNTGVDQLVCRRCSERLAGLRP
jgi:hypothetical protein